MADTKVSALTADTAPTSDDLIYTVTDPGGTPASRKVTIANLWAAQAKGRTIATLQPEGSRPTGTLYAQLSAITDGSTPTSITPVLAYDGAAQDEHAEWDVTIPSWYSGNGLTFVVKYAMSGTDADAVQFEVRAKTLADTADLDSNLAIQSQTPTDITDTPTGTQNAMMVTAAGNVTHANAGSPAAGDTVRIRVSRDFDHASNTNDAQLVSVHVTETA
jgi:hypothetical protein